MDVSDLVAIDVHTHAEVSCRQPADAFWQPYEDAANKYFKAGKRPTIAETIAYYRERKIGLVMFTVDSEFEIGARRIPNDEVAEAARANSDIMMAFASHRSAQGQDGRARGARLIAAASSRLQIPSDRAGFFPNDRMAYGLYEVIAEQSCRRSSIAAIPASAPACRAAAACASNTRNPIHVDDVAVDFPDMTIIIAHPSWPWQDEALSVCLHKPNVYIDLSGW